MMSPKQHLCARTFGLLAVVATATAVIGSAPRAQHERGADLREAVPSRSAAEFAERRGIQRRPADQSLAPGGAAGDPEGNDICPADSQLAVDQLLTGEPINGTASQIGGPFGDPPTFPPEVRAADHFALDEDAAITRITWHTLEPEDGIAWAGEVRVELYEDGAECLPGAELLVVDMGGVTREVIEPAAAFGLDRVRYTIDGIEIDLSAGIYWIALAPISGETSSQSFWEWSADTLIKAGECSALVEGGHFNIPAWQPINEGDGGRLSFQICTLFEACPGEGSCFQANDTPGCEDAECCEAICNVDAFCCEVEWDSLCASQAADICGNCGEPEAGSCFGSNPSPGCADAECCAAICADDPFCCEVQWDSLCVEQALDTCGSCGDPEAGSCFEPNPTPGCADAECCAAICADDAFCCSEQWDSLCAAAAAESEACEPPPVCPGEGSCFQANDTPGCEDADCCEMICTVDAFCCEVEWDSLCANQAAEICGNCGDPEAGSCFESNPTPGCDDADCCAAICADDPFCCEVQWDSICADDAAESDACTPPVDPCPEDLTGDGNVGVDDLLTLLAAWGTPDADLTGDGNTGVDDLLALLAAWGPCPEAESCAGHCGGPAPAGCWCDEACVDFGDCCPDDCIACPDLPHCPVQ